ncbi:MAG: M28 family peptidase [Thermoplasmatales archaeon]|nr:M28 family peptidase [Thermoplasmatales archaeon]MCK4995858.1 M28 family peptidase [Thermoplasmatales archaeon]
MRKLIAICVVIVLCCSSTTVFALQKQSIIQSDDDNKTISQSNFDDIIPSIIEQIDETMMTTFIMDLVDFGPHPTASPECNQAAEYIYDHFENMGLEVRYQDWYIDSSLYGKNIEATLPGLSDEIYLISAHYDTWDNSPGADDNSAGVAAVITAAYILKQYSFNHTIRFVVFSGEEQGLHGSHFYAKEAYDNCENIIANINLDMMGYATNPQEEGKIRIYENPLSSWIVNEYTIPISQQYADLIDFEVLVYDDPTGHGSDYLKFWKFGHDALFYHEYKWNPYIHTPNDILENMNVNYATKVARFAIATLAKLANSPIIDNSKPETPSSPDGPSIGNIFIKHTFTTSTIDPEGDDVYYMFDWGDETNSGWLGPYNSGEVITASHTWTKLGPFSVKVKSKDVHGIQSGWSNVHPITMPRSSCAKDNFIFRILEKIIDIIPNFLIILFLLLT